MSPPTRPTDADLDRIAVHILAHKLANGVESLTLARAWLERRERDKEIVRLVEQYATENNLPSPFSPASEPAALLAPPIIAEVTESEIARELIVLHRKAAPALADACERLLERVTELEKVVGGDYYSCQVCGQRHPARYLFDLKGSVPGGRRVTCAACAMTLDSHYITSLRERIAELEADLKVATKCGCGRPLSIGQCSICDNDE